MTLLQRLQLQLRFNLWARLRINRHHSYNLSHSQFGEDMVARGLLDDRTLGTYIDVGAHHPVYYSNTYHFYRRGWSGMNIDALPGSMEAFRVLRPRDINLEACIASESGQEIELFLFDSPALSTTDRALAEKHEREGAKRMGSVPLRTITLGEAIETHLKDRTIDLFSIDIEGGDEAILRSNDFARCRPRVVIFERHECDLSNDPLIGHLRSLGYQLEGKCGPSMLMQIGGAK